MNAIRICTIIAFLSPALFGQKVLFDDIFMDFGHSAAEWDTLIDTLSNHGIEVYMVSDKGWDFLDSVDVLWLESPGGNHPEEIKDKIINFCRNGGRILFGCTYTSSCNNLLLDSRWHTGLRVIELDYSPNLAELIPFPPFTNGIHGVRLFFDDRKIIEIDDSSIAFPFVFFKFIRKPILAISYPFLGEGSCNYIIVFSTTHTYEIPGGVVIPQNYSEDYKLMVNLFLTMCDMPGYHLEPCARPEPVDTPLGVCLCSPNPFTPNGDGKNEVCHFGFKGMESAPTTITIYDLHSVKIREINVPLGVPFVYTDALWDGRDFSGNPVPQGVYLYVIEQEGKIICTGTVTVAR